jgi:hypothetical protein
VSDHRIPKLRDSNFDKFITPRKTGRCGVHAAIHDADTADHPAGGAQVQHFRGVGNRPAVDQHMVDTAMLLRTVSETHSENRRSAGAFVFGPIVTRANVVTKNKIAAVLLSRDQQPGQGRAQCNIHRPISQ